MGDKHHAPKDVARALTAAGIPTHPETIRRRCRVPAHDAHHIETNPAFPGRFHIPERELARLLGAKAAVA